MAIWNPLICHLIWMKALNVTLWAANPAGVEANVSFEFRQLGSVFTNGTLIDEQYLDILNRNRNLVPILSIEGNKETTDKRRGDGVYLKLNKTMNYF